jgi:hypothetical protein
MNDTSRGLSPKTIAFFSLPLSLPKHKRVAMQTHYYNERSEKPDPDKKQSLTENQSARIPKIPTPAWKPCNFFFPQKNKNKINNSRSAQQRCRQQTPNCLPACETVLADQATKTLGTKTQFSKEKKNHAKPEAPLKNYLLKYLLPRHQHAHLCSLCVRLFSRARARALSLSLSLVLSRPKCLSHRAHRLQRQGCDGPLVTRVYMNNHVILPLY